jgi:hypothetical protein
VRRRFGQEALERIAQPLIEAVSTLLTLKQHESSGPQCLSLPRKWNATIAAFIMSPAQAGERKNCYIPLEPSGARYGLFPLLPNLSRDADPCRLASRPAPSFAAVQLNTRVVSAMPKTPTREGWITRDTARKQFRLSTNCLL